LAAVRFAMGLPFIVTADESQFRTAKSVFH
jgi:hypothetical protein